MCGCSECEKLVVLFGDVCVQVAALAAGVFEPNDLAGIDVPMEDAAEGRKSERAEKSPQSDEESAEDDDDDDSDDEESDDNEEETLEGMCGGRDKVVKSELVGLYGYDRVDDR